MFEDLFGADLAVALAGVDPTALDADAALGYALAAARLASWAAAVEAVGLAQLLHIYPAPQPAAVGEDVHHLDTDRLVLAEVRAGYGCSTNAASARMSFAEFVHRIPAAASALAAGVIRVEHARLLARDTAPLNGGLRTAVVEDLLAGHAAAVQASGSGWTMRQWTLRTARAVLAADPSRAEQTVADTQAARRVWHTTDTGHAEGTLALTGPVEQTAACHAAVDALARRWHAEGRAGTLDQLRFDAAHRLLTGADYGRPAAGVDYGQVTIPLSSLVGVDDAPGELAGVGPIPASLARQLMAQASGWRRLLTDPIDGHLVTQQIKTYRPSAAMRRFVLARSGGVCSARGCGARHDLQLDHVIPFPGRADQCEQLRSAVPAGPQRQNSRRLGACARPRVWGAHPDQPTRPALHHHAHPASSGHRPPRPTGPAHPRPGRAGPDLLPHRRAATGSRRRRDRTTGPAGTRGPLAGHRRAHPRPNPHRPPQPASQTARHCPSRGCRASTHPPNTRRTRIRHRLPTDRRHQRRIPRRRPRGMTSRRLSAAGKERTSS
jgi:hypothetical protein